MKVSVIGTGYVGLVAAAAFAEHGNNVICADINEDKIAALKRGEIPIFEPGLEPMVQRNVKEGRLHFTTSNEEAAAHADVLLLAVGTPTGTHDGAPDLSGLIAAARSCAGHIKGYTVIVNKSTVPVGTSDRITRVFKEGGASDYAVISNPEFLKEGVALQDFMYPDRVVIGSNDERATEIMRRLYQPFMRSQDRLIVMDPRSAEITKYACNAYLATRVSFINDIANLCDAVGADVSHVRKGMGTDSRIGHKFLYPGIGYGGSCFPKDARAILRTGREHGVPLSIVAAADRINEIQKLVLLRKLRDQAGGDLAGKVISLWGLAFKPNTDDVREAPSLSIARGLISAGAKLRLFDPEATDNFWRDLGISNERSAVDSTDETAVFDDPYDAASSADALVLCTEWRQFRSPDFGRLKEIMNGNQIYDGRNLWNRAEIESQGFEYHAIGR